MTLDLKTRELLRDSIKAKLIEAHEKGLKERLVIEDLDVLETVMFEELFGSKYIAIRSDFLRYLDLSKVSFDGVNFNYSQFGENYYINLSGTNVNIDFNKAYKRSDHVCVSNCSFEDVDLSNNRFDINSDKFIPIEFHNCNLSNCNLTIDGLRKIKFYNCDLSYNDLEKDMLSFDDFLHEDAFKYGSLIIDRDCNLYHTSASIECSKYIKKNGLLDIYLKNGNYKGCYICEEGKNRVYLDDHNESKEKRITFNRNKKNKEQFINSVVDSLDRQISNQLKLKPNKKEEE